MLSLYGKAISIGTAEAIGKRIALSITGCDRITYCLSRRRVLIYGEHHRRFRREDRCAVDHFAEAIDKDQKIGDPNLAIHIQIVFCLVTPLDLFGNQTH